VVAQYAVLGLMYIVNIVEAPDNRSVVRVQTQLTMRGSFWKITTLPALPHRDFLATLHKKLVCQDRVTDQVNLL